MIHQAINLSEGRPPGFCDTCKGSGAHTRVMCKHYPCPHCGEPTVLFFNACPTCVAFIGDLPNYVVGLDKIRETMAAGRIL